MTKIINYGVIGCGMMGQEHLRNIALLDGARVQAIFEPDAGMADKAGAIVPDAVFYASVGDLLADDALDCLLVVSPNYLHVEQLEEIARTRPLPLLMEKPLYTDPDHAARIDAVKASYPAPIWVAMEYRYMPPVAKFLNELESATGGVKMLTIREHRFPFLTKVGDWNRFNAKTGGTLVEKCCHFFDLMRVALRSDPVRVMASAGQAVNHIGETYDGADSDIWDSGYVIVDFANGTRAMLELCMFAEGSRYQEELSAVGPKGKIEALVPGPGRFWPEHLGEPPVSQVIVSPRAPKGPVALEIPVEEALLEAGDHNGSTFYQHQNFLAVVRGEKPVDVTLSDGAWAVRIGHAAQKSAETGACVNL
ncbi:Gfo/Idh/MocA family oxidoreductase [uncultured Pelagimonas sp.]|uniref:Gfo/Idh/MocA family protein n=1 Tax=uncultured Pelagimonas sp. TaxID=1618102 RepID=UPI0026275270|nr:Gfo/Idh/MocA family oxidoreductase [uncultured Pelagimonas sp.]